MILSELVGQIKQTIKAHSDDTNYTDQYIYSLARAARATLLSGRTEKYKMIGPNNIQSICVPLVRTKFHDCECIEVGCDILKSAIEIPSVIVKDSKPLITVRFFSGGTLPYVTPEHQISNRSSNVLVDAVGYYIKNRFLYIWNTLDLKAVIVEGVFEDPLVLRDFKICNEDGDIYDDCVYDPLKQPFPIDENLVFDLKQLVYKELGISLQLQSDTTNDGQSNL